MDNLNSLLIAIDALDGDFSNDAIAKRDELLDKLYHLTLQVINEVEESLDYAIACYCYEEAQL